MGDGGGAKMGDDVDEVDKDIGGAVDGGEEVREAGEVLYPHWPVYFLILHYTSLLHFPDIRNPFYTVDQDEYCKIRINYPFLLTDKFTAANLMTNLPQTIPKLSTDNHQTK